MGWLDGLTTNRADLGPDASDSRLRSITLSRPPAQAVPWAADVIARLPRWTVVAVDPDAGAIHATHATRLWGFVDDVQVRVEPEGSGSRVVGHSQSRVGKGDFGQNARNLRELAEALRSADRTSS